MLSALVAALAGAPLFLLVAVRSSDDVREPAMRAWLESPSVTHMHVGALAPDAARERTYFHVFPNNSDAFTSFINTFDPFVFVIGK